MAEIVRWDPFQEMLSLRDAMDQLVQDSFVRPSNRAGGFQPAMDLAETEHEYVVKLAVPGLEPDNFEITMQQNMLTIHGKIEEEQEQEGVRHHLKERRFGDFTRVIQFPTQVDADKIQADLSNGILMVRVPKAESAKPKRIEVKTKTK